MVRLSDVKWDTSVYPRSKWISATVERYAEALEAGAEFPPIVLEAGTNRILDGKHRFEAYRQLGREEIPAEWHTVPDGVSAKYYAATLSCAHGDRLTNADLKALAEEEFQHNPSLSAAEWGRRLGVPERTVRRWVSHITDRWRRSRSLQAWHLHQLGWTQEEIGEKLGVSQDTISLDTKNGHLAEFRKVLGPDWNDKGLQQEAERLGIPLIDAWAAALDGLPDDERLERLGIKLQPYDVWQFNFGCHPLMGRQHPGRIPGELVIHVLAFFSEAGDLVVDPMAGSGTTLDACLLMGRRCRAYDIDLRHERGDIEFWDVMQGWPATVRKAALIFWDPPYFRAKDGGEWGLGGADGYVEGSISRLDRDVYLAWFRDAFAELHSQVRPGTRLAFLMMDTGQHAKRPEDAVPIFIWDYAQLIQQAGWRFLRHIQCPLPTQQAAAYDVTAARRERRLVCLARYLLVAVRD